MEKFFTQEKGNDPCQTEIPLCQADSSSCHSEPCLQGEESHQDSKRCLSLREFTSSRSRIANAQHDKVRFK
ncbi:hypothetical protein [Helicobacter aurati]|uniref:hypothetical protein n=1 Tax=Helicobacter aurati TaxID=137778 RepID=UPI0011C06D9E|nr:hypothetical protein [Helicobacter aurati]